MKGKVHVGGCSAPDRLVSLVPCITHTILRLGAAGRLVGVTRYCPSAAKGFDEFPPSTIVRGVWPPPGPAIVGGIHDVDFDLLASLNPDLVLADPDENGRANMERLARGFPLEEILVRSVADSLSFLHRMGHLLGAEEEAERLVRSAAEPVRAPQHTGRGCSGARMHDLFLHGPLPGSGGRHHAVSQSTIVPSGELPAPPCRRSVAVLVWKDPWIAAGAGTYAAAILEHRGQRNCVTLPGYPQVALPDLLSLCPDALLLPSEPYDFTAQDEDDLRRVFLSAGTSVERVDGRDLFWYGAWMAEGRGEGPAAK